MIRNIVMADPGHYREALHCPLHVSLSLLLFGLPLTFSRSYGEITHARTRAKHAPLTRPINFPRNRSRYD